LRRCHDAFRPRPSEATRVVGPHSSGFAPGRRCVIARAIDPGAAALSVRRFVLRTIRLSTTAMVEFRSIDTLRQALAPVEALRGEQSELESWVRESFATLDSLHGELSDWQRDLTRQQALIDQRQAAADDAGDALAQIAEYEQRLAEADQQYRQLEAENAEQLQTLEEVEQQLAAAKAELRVLHRDGHEHVEERRQWLAELRELRRTAEAQSSLLQRLAERPAEEGDGDGAVEGASLGSDGSEEPTAGDDDVACRSAELRRRADSRRAAQRRPS
jgi:chromosome segregation ATPase